MDDAAKASNAGAVAKSGSTNALAAASAKQFGLPAPPPSSMSKSSPAVAPWHRSAPLPAPPTSAAPWQKPAALPAPPKAQWPGAPGVDPAAGVLGTTAGTFTVAKSLPVPAASPATISEYRRRLVTIYSLRNPSNLAKVDYLLDKYKGREDLLYTSVRTKYQIPETWDGRQPLIYPGSRENATAATSTVEKLKVAPPAASPEKPKAAPVAPSKVAPWELLKANSSKAPEGDGKPPWARKAKRKAEVVEAAAEPKVEELEAISEALAALQTLTEDMGDGGDDSVPSKPLKAPAEEPPEEKTDPLKDESQKAPQPEDTPKPAEPSAEEVRPPEAATASAPEPEPAPPESAPAASAEPRMRRPPTPPRPRRKLPRSEAEAKAPPAMDPRRRPVSDDDEVVVVSVNGRDAGDMDEDAKLGEQMRQALGASLAATRREAAREEPAQMALPVVPMPEPVANEAESEEAEAPEAAPVPPAPTPAARPRAEAPDAKRLAAAAAAARGARGLQGRESDSDSDSEYSSMSSDDEEEEEEAQPLMALPVPTGGPEPDLNGKGPKTAEPKGHKEDKALRQKLLGQIFEQLSDYCGTPKRSPMKGMQRFVTMVGFEGSDNEWKDEYKSLCKEWKVEPSKGFTQEAFNKMVDDSSPRGCYCTNEELKIILDKFLATPRVPKAPKGPKVRKQAPAPPDRPPKKQKVEVQFQ